MSPLTEDRFIRADVSCGSEGVEKEVLVSLRPATEQSAGEEVASYLGDLVGQRQYLDRKGCFTGEQVTLTRKSTRVCSSYSVLPTYIH